METIKLLRPIKIDGKNIKELQIRKPKAGELRGIYLLDLFQMKTETILTVLPRVASPHLTQEQAFNLDIADVVAVGSAMVGFFNQDPNTPLMLMN